MLSKQSEKVPQYLRDFDGMLLRWIIGNKKSVLPLLKMKYEGIYFEIFKELKPNVEKLVTLIRRGINNWWLRVDHRSVECLEDVEKGISLEIFIVLEMGKRVPDDPTKTTVLNHVAEKIYQIKERRKFIASSLQTADVVPFEAERFHKGDELMDYEIKGIFFPWMFMQAFEITKNLTLIVNLSQSVFGQLFEGRRRYNSWAYITAFVLMSIKELANAFKGEAAAFRKFDKMEDE